MTTPKKLRMRVLLDWLEGKLPEREAIEVARAVDAGGHELRGTVAWLRGFLETTDQHRLEPVPTIVGHRLHQHFRTWTADADLPHPEVDGILPADLVFDSRRDAPRTAVRSGGGHGATFQLAYTCEAGDVVLDVSPGADALVRIDGQVLVSATTEPVFHAELTTSDARVRSLGGDGHGRFTLTDVPATQARMQLRNGEVAITLDVDLEGPA